MNKTMSTVVTIFVLLIIILQTSYSVVLADENKDFIVKEEIGKWEKNTATEMRTVKESGVARLVLEYSNADLGSWQGNIQISLSGESGDKINGKYIIELVELNFTIEYSKTLYPGIFMGIRDKKSVELIIKHDNKVLYFKNETVTWPFIPRLDTRIYYSIWRRDNNMIGVTVQDYYGHILKNLSIFWAGNITYTGQSLTLRITAVKNSGKPAQLSSYLYYNDVVENEKYTELSVKTLNIDTSIMFYTSIGFLLIAIIANVFSKSLTRKVPQQKPETSKPLKEKRRKKKK